MTVKWNTPEQEAAIIARWFRDDRERQERHRQWLWMQIAAERQLADDFEAAWEWG